MFNTTYKTVDVDGYSIFYREAGDPANPTLLLLHGFPTASHMFRDLLPLLADRFHLIAPDLPGFGLSALPSRNEFSYTFDNLAQVIGRFTEVIDLERFAIYIFDYGAPVGLRIAMANPERISSIISQNGNAYLEGLNTIGLGPMERYWHQPNEENREALRGFLAPEAIRWQYEHGVPNPEQVSPDGSTLDAWYMQRPGVKEIQLDLFLDYASNLALYPAFQAYFREHQPKLLAIWGSNDPFFTPEGAKSYGRDLPQARVHLIETGHFALETHVEEIATEIRKFLAE